MHQCNAAKAELLTTTQESLAVPRPNRDPSHEYCVHSVPDYRNANQYYTRQAALHHVGPLLRITCSESEVSHTSPFKYTHLYPFTEGGLVVHQR